MAIEIQPASVKLTDANGKDHYYPLKSDGKTLQPMEPEVYQEFAQLGGVKVLAEAQMENSPNRVDFGNPDTFGHHAQEMQAKLALEQIEHPEKFAKGETPAEIEKNRQALLHDKAQREQFEREIDLATTPPPMNDQERAALTPRTEDEYWARAIAMQQGWNSLGYDLVPVPSIPLMGANSNTPSTTEPMLEVRYVGTNIALYRGPLVVLEKRLQLDQMERARRTETLRLHEEYQEKQRRELAEARANTPEAKIARQDAELAELKRKDAEREAELDAMRYQMRQVVARQP